MNFKGTIIEESLDEKSILQKVKVISTKIEKVSPRHKTPWIQQWTLYAVEINETIVEEVAQLLSEGLDKDHAWYADFKNEKYHFIVYKDKVFKVDLSNPIIYSEAKKYGISLGIPEYQVDFAPENITILVFTEGTILMFLSGKGLSREEVICISKAAGIQREESNLAFENNTTPSEVPKGAVYDFSSYIPIGNAVEKLVSWKKQGAIIYYLSSRRVKGEIKTIRNILQTYDFPDSQNLLYRQQGEDYKDVAEKLMPDILIEDDCESIGGENEMTFTHMSDKAKTRVHLITIKEFSGIDNLPGNIEQLKTY